MQFDYLKFGDSGRGYAKHKDMSGSSCTGPE
jgi:hypothetical protein